jgi:hypothetical protein
VGYSIAGTSSTCAPTYLWRERIRSCASTTMAMRSCNHAGIRLLVQERSRRRLLPVGRHLESTSCGVLTRCVFVHFFGRCRWLPLSVRIASCICAFLSICFILTSISLQTRPSYLCSHCAFSPSPICLSAGADTRPLGRAV